MKDSILTILVIFLFIGWLAAEIRGSKIIRISLGVICMMILGIGIYVVMQSSDMLLAMHRYCLQKIEKKIESGEIKSVQQSIQSYEQTYQETSSTKAAITQMIEQLSKTEE